LHLCDIEKGRKSVSPERASRFARELGYSEEQFVRLALQQLVEVAGLKFQVVLNPIKAVSTRKPITVRRPRAKSAASNPWPLECDWFRAIRDFRR
jgi:hypothetical protein